MIIKVGDALKVKRNDITRTYGVRIHNRAGDKYDTQAMPGEIGTVTEGTYVAHDGSTVTHHWIQFSRNRRFTLQTDDNNQPTFLLPRYAENFLKLVKRPESSR